MALTNAGRGKAYTEPALIWAVRIHDSAYWNDDAYDVERTIRHLAKKDRERFSELAEHAGLNKYGFISERVLEALKAIVETVIAERERKH